MSVVHSRVAPLALVAMLWAGHAFAAPVDDAVAEIIRAWDVIKYQVPPNEQAPKFETLAAKAHQVSAAFPDRAEPLVWEGIVVSSLAGAKGGMGALSLAKQAKELYESALKIDPTVLGGSAYGSLGVLYYKVPRWPVGFGDKAKAQELLQKALAINPTSIDANFFYGEYLIEDGKPGEAKAYLQRAIDAPPRTGREIADAGRRAEARALLEKARTQSQ